MSDTKAVLPRKPRSNGSITINVNFNPREFDLITHVDEQGLATGANFSGYIKHLIRKDIAEKGDK